MKGISRILLACLPLLALAACRQPAAPPQAAKMDTAAARTAPRLADALSGHWEPFSNGALPLGALDLDQAAIRFAKAGAATVAAKDGFVALRWSAPPSPAAADLCAGQPPRTAQISAVPDTHPARLEIAFFSSEKPAADRSTDLNLCAIQTWSRAAEASKKPD